MDPTPTRVMPVPPVWNGPKSTSDGVVPSHVDSTGGGAEVVEAAQVIGQGRGTRHGGLVHVCQDDGVVTTGH